MTVILIILFFALLPFAPVYVSATAPVVTEDGEELGNITLVARARLYDAILTKILTPTQIRIILPFKNFEKGDD